jgi:prepilin-type N-terminal cleavage/methylation domain-containing protein
MKNTMNNQKGFTLVELILCVAILGMMTAAIAPSFGNLLATSTGVSGKGTAGAIQSAINTQMGTNLLNGLATIWPTSLETVATNGTCSALANGCFDAVSSQPIRDAAWSKSGATYTYTKNSVTQVYQYTSGTGQLTCTSGC